MTKTEVTTASSPSTAEFQERPMEEVINISESTGSEIFVNDIEHPVKRKVFITGSAQNVTIVVDYKEQRQRLKRFIMNKSL